MKRNLSSQAIRAMAIGMAVTLGSATAVSGVVTGTVVNVYAANFEQSTFAEAKIEKESTDLKITITAADGKKFSGSGDLTGLVVKTADGSKEVANKSSGVTPSIEGGDAGNKLVIKVPISELSQNTLTGKETSLKITSLKSTSVKYGDASGSQDSLAFDTGDFTLNTNSSIELDIDNTAPTLQGATATYKNETSKFRVEITLKNDTLATLGEQQSSDDKFTVKPTSSGAIGSETNDAKVTAYEVSSGKLILTLNKELVDGKYTVTYAKKDTQLKDEANNELVQSPNNTVELTVTSAPLVETTKYDENSKIITLTLNKELNDQIATKDKEKHGFVVKNSSKEEQVIKQVTVKGKEVIIELGIKDNLVEGTYTIGYTKKDRAEFVVAKDGGKLDTNENLATFKISDTVKPPVQGDLTATTADGNYTFKKIGSNDKEVALVGFTTVQTRAAQTNTFENGVLTAEGKTYTLTQIGDGTKVDGLTTKALEGHTSNVTTIKENAFNGNTNVTTLTFPNVTKVEANAFSGATSLTSIDLGSASTGLTVATDAFKGASKLKNIATSTENKDKVDAAIKGSNLQDTTTVITDENSNDTNATIAKDKFYQTKEGLIFKGLSNKELSFEGKDKFTAPTEPNGLTGETKEKAYLVTYANGIVTLKAGETTPQPPATENFEVNNVNGKKLTFTTLSGKKEVALTGVGDATRGLESNILRDGVLTVNGNAYDFTQIGDGITSLGVDFKANEVLGGNLDKVTTVAKDAFKGNTTLTKISLPNVTTIEEGAFNGTIALTEVFLGDKEVTVGKNAFTGANSSIKVSSNNNKTLENLKKSETGLEAGKVENAAPFVTSAVVNKDAANKVVVTFSEKVYAPLDITANNFTIEGSSNNLTVSTVKGLEKDKSKAGTIITLELNDNVKYNDKKISLKYKKAGNAIKDTEDIEFKDTAKNIEIDNKVEAPVLKPVKATLGDVKVNDKTLTINVNNPTLKVENSLGKKGFTVTKGKDSTNVPVDSVKATDNTIVLTLNSGITADDTEVKVKYDGTNEKLIDNSTNNPIDSIESQFVVNELDVTAPMFDNSNASAVAGSGTTYTITLPIKEPIKLKTGNLNKAKFQVKEVSSGETNIEQENITSVSIGKDSKSIVLVVKASKTLNQGSDKFKVIYTKDDNIVDFGANSGKPIEGVTIDNIAIQPGTGSIIFAQSDEDTDLVAIAPVQVMNQNGDVTSITSVKGANAIEINSILTDKLTKINSGAFKDVAQDLELDFSKVNVSNLNIESGAFSGAKGLNITGVNSSDTEKLAEMIGSSSGIKINGKTTQDIIKDNSNSGNGGSGSGGGSSSGGSGGGSGANIGTITNKKPNTEETTSQGNKNETVVENKQLNFDVIKLPSVEGEAKVFGDVSANHWAKSYIDKLSTARIINGSNGMFNPNGQTKRADVTVMLVNLLGLTPEANNKFADVNASAYYAPYVGTASTYGIVNGSNGMFNPQGVISRQDTMVMIAQILKGLNLNVNADTTALSQFGDASKVSAYANESVAILVNSGIIAGNNGKLNPTAPVTRAEMATIMSKLYDVLASANK